MSRIEGTVLKVNCPSPLVHGIQGRWRMFRLSQCGLLACTHPLSIASGNNKGWRMILHTESLPQGKLKGLRKRPGKVMPGKDTTIARNIRKLITTAERNTPRPNPEHNKATICLSYIQQNTNIQMENKQKRPLGISRSSWVQTFKK